MLVAVIVVQVIADGVVAPIIPGADRSSLLPTIAASLAISALDMLAIVALSTRLFSLVLVTSSVAPNVCPLVIVAEMVHLLIFYYVV